MRAHRILVALAVAFGLAACAGAPSSRDEAVTHSVEVYELTSAFFQTATLRSQSLRWQTDAGGFRWPVGITLNAWAHQSMVEDNVDRWLQFRHDLLYPGDALDDAYELADAMRNDMARQCGNVQMWADGEAIALPVDYVSAQVFTDRTRMPAPVTDVQPDPLESIVEDNPPYRLVVSTRVHVQPDDDIFARLVSAQTLRYDLCGSAAAATPDELDGLRKVYQWRRQ